MKPSLQNANLPEPIWRNTPVFFKIIYKSIFLIPRSHFGHFLPLLSWLDNASGTLHLAVDPRLQSSRFSRCNGWMVIEFMFARFSKNCCSAEDKVNFVLWTGKSQACCMVGNWFWTGQLRDNLCFFFPISGVKSTHFSYDRLKRTAHLHIHSMTRIATSCVYERFTKPVSNWRLHF